jgi:hypothetical protein
VHARAQGIELDHRQNKSKGDLQKAGRRYDGSLVSDLTPHASAGRAQTLFAAGHGVVQMSLNGQFAGFPREYLIKEVKAPVTDLAHGMQYRIHARWKRWALRPKTAELKRTQ